MSSDLRLILLLLGIGVVAAVYAWSYFQASRKRSATSSGSGLRALDNDEPDDSAIQAELQRMQQVLAGEGSVGAGTTSEAKRPATVPDEGLVILSVVAADGQRFAGDVLRKALENNELVYGEKRIFHRVIRLDGDDQPVFSLANMVKPGDFASAELAGFETAGVTLFLELPALIDNLEAFDDFVHTAERLAVELGGQLRDQHRCVITHQALMQLREQLAEADLHPRIAS